MSGVAAAGLLVRFFGLPLPGPRPQHHDVGLGETPDGVAVTGRLWVPDRPAPAIVLAGGITPRGIDDPRLVRLATALSATRRVVFAPELGLAQRRLDPTDVDRIAHAVGRLRRHPAVDGGVALLGFSFGGSYALVAASRPEVAADVDVVAAFGAYADLAGLLPAVGELEDLRPHLDAALGADHGGALDAEEHAALMGVLEEGAPVSTLPGGLRGRLSRLSPADAGPVPVPVSLIHARDDPVIPHGEIRSLAAAFPHARSYEVELFTHVDFRPTPRRLRRAAIDLTALWRFARDVLEPGDPPRASGARRRG